MQHTITSKALASWQSYLERRTTKQHAMMLHVASIHRRAFSAFRSMIFLSSCE